MACEPFRFHVILQLKLNWTLCYCLLWKAKMNKYLGLTTDGNQHTVEGWSQSNFLECGQTACGKVAMTGSQQGHSNPSKHKGIAIIWRIQNISITNIINTREPIPRTANYCSASTTLHYKQSFCHNGLIWKGVDWVNEGNNEKKRNNNLWERKGRR